MISMEFFSDSRDKRETFRDDFRLRSRVCLFLKAPTWLLCGESLWISKRSNNCWTDHFFVYLWSIDIGEHLFVLWGLILIKSRPATSTSGSDRESLSVKEIARQYYYLLCRLLISFFTKLDLLHFPFPFPVYVGGVYFGNELLLNLFIAGFSLCQGTCLK